MTTFGLIFAIYVSCFIRQTTAIESIDTADLQEKFHRLTSLMKDSAILRLTQTYYKEFVNDSPRNYSTVVMLTALDRRRSCHSCQDAYDEFHLLAISALQQGKSPSPVLFAVADFDESPEIFNTLNQNTVPVFIHFPPVGHPANQDFMDISRNSFSAEVLARWVLVRTGEEIAIERAPNYSNFILFFIVIGVASVTFYLRPQNFEFVFNKSTISYTCMILVFYMTSGQVWNSIRRPPAFHTSQDGGIALVYPSNDYQFIAETVIVMATYVFISTSVVVLTDVRSTQDPGKRRIMAMTGIGMFVLFISLCISLFRKKYQGYPYSFLLK